MADQKVSDLPSLNGADVDAADLLYIVDSSAGTAGSKKITVGQYQLAPYSAGTANGVMYLNGSNVVTTGSALTFDGTSFTVAGAYGTSTTGFTLSNTTGFSASNIARFDFKVNNSFGGLERVAAIWALNPNAAGNNGGALVFGTSANGTATTPTEGMRLDSSGNLGLGVTPSAWAANHTALQITTAGAQVWSDDAQAAWFSTNTYASASATYRYLSSTFAAAYRLQRSTGNHQWFTAPSGTAGNAITFTQAMTLTSGGELLVGTTSTTPNPGVVVGPSGFISTGNSAGSSGFVFQYFSRNGSTIGSVSQNGTTAVLFNTTSDRRLKDNIVPAPSASDVIDAIQIVSHDWKAAPDEHVTYGVIAQDLHAVAPQAVLQGDDGEEVEKTWGVDYSKLVPMLIKEIQSLRARVAALEAQ